MRFRTPTNSVKKSSKRWKSSPPTDDKSIPLQHCRPITTNVQQARGPALELELFEPSPVNLRYDDEADHCPFHVAVKPKYPRDELRCAFSYDADSNQSRREPNNSWPSSQKPLTAFGLFSFMVLAVASLYLINFGNHSFDGVHNNSGSAQSFFIYDKTSFLRNSHGAIVTGPPRTFFLGESFDQGAKSFRQAPGRRLVDYPAEYSDVTQLYGHKSSNDVDVAGTMERKFFPMHELAAMEGPRQQKYAECVPMSSWHTESFPTCNSLHELGIAPSLYDDSLRLLSSAGSWRDAWRFKDYVAPSNGKQILDNVVIKTIKFQHTLQDRYFEFSRVDALSMERLTSSPYVMDMHGFCGVSVMTERGVDDIAHVVDHLSPRGKVDLARKVAKSIAAVHEINGRNSAVALVHNDINVGNIFWGQRNNPLLNDFNIAVLMMKDRETGESCPFPGHFPNPQWKSPEEQAGPDGNSIGELDEKVDIYALGNLLFRFATGKGPWRELASSNGAKLTDEQKKHIAHLKVEEGKMPPVPARTLKLNDPYIGVLLKAMEWCYRFKPEERPTAREVAEFLEKSKNEVEHNLVEFGRLPKAYK